MQGIFLNWLYSIGGTSASFDVMNKYFGISQMPVAGSTYWNIDYL